MVYVFLKRRKAWSTAKIIITSYSKIVSVCCSYTWNIPYVCIGFYGFYVGELKNTIKHRVGCTSKWSPGPSAIFHPKSESAVSFYACLDGYRMTGWWFGTFFSPYIRNNDPN